MSIDKQKKLTKGKGWELVFDPTIKDPPKPPKLPKELEKQNFKKGGRVKLNTGGYIGKYIKGDLGGKKVSNPSYVKYYKGLV